MDPVVLKYFRKILNSFSMGLLWMFSVITAGFYFKLAMVGKSFLWYNGVFYACFVISLVLLVWYFYRTWRHPDVFGEEN